MRRNHDDVMVSLIFINDCLQTYQKVAILLLVKHENARRSEIKGAKWTGRNINKAVRKANFTQSTLAIIIC